MLTKTFGRILTALSLALLPACTKAPEEKAGERLVITVRAENPATKTVLSDDGAVTSLAFTSGDQLGFFADGILSNIQLDYDEKADMFIGQAWVDSEQAEYREAVDYYAYYPFSIDAGKDLTALNGILPAKQVAPFDPRADFLVADPVTDDYFADNFPSLSLEFNTHLFAIVRLSVTNSNPDYAGEEILSIGLKSTGTTPLAGQFTFSAEDGSVTFTDDPNYLRYAMEVVYGKPPVLGTGTEHSVYAVVNPATYANGSLNLVVRTTNYTFTIPSTKVFRPRTYEMTALSTVDLAKADNPSPSARTLVLWGSSSIGSALVKQVQLQLGSKWKVIGCGSSGDTGYGIAARQGGLPVFTQDSAFTLPASSEEYVDIDGLYWLYDDGITRKYGLADHLQYFNPLLIEGVECEISGSKTAGFRLRRLADGEDPLEIPARSNVSTYASRTYADADVIVGYLGLNGRSNTSDEQLIFLYDSMKAHLTNPDAVMIVWGFSQSAYDLPKYWSQDYVDLFTGHFGEFFMDQRTLGNQDAVNLMYEIGQITDESEISDTDRKYIERGDWPLSWFQAVGDVHANSRGQQVYAILLRRRMAELGLL